MPERPDSDQLRTALDGLSAAADRAWQDRPCLPAARFWQAALEVKAYGSAEQEHLAACPACRRREQDVQQAARPEAAQLAAGDVHIADQPLKIGTPVGKTASRVSAPQWLSFPSDPQLRARVILDKAGPAFFEVEHGAWPSGTLVRLTIAAAAGTDPCRAWLAPLRSEKGLACARIGLGDSTLVVPAKAFVHVQKLAPGQLTERDVPLLCDAMDLAAGDARMLAAWQEWGHAALKAGAITDAVRAAIVQIMPGFGLRPEAGGR